MKILIMNWNSYAGEDIIEAFKRAKDKDGKPVEAAVFSFSGTEERSDAVYEEKLADELRKERPDAVFSFNYYPIISAVCAREKTEYISVVYDNPHIALYSFTTINPTNHIYVFDSNEARKFRDQGISTVSYLPLAAPVRRLDSIYAGKRDRDRFSCDISFVGSLYCEGHNFYDRMLPKLDDYAKGYLEAVMASQLAVSGINFVEDCLVPDIVSRMEKAFPMPPNADGVETQAWIYANYMLNRKITQMERDRFITDIGERFGGSREFFLYTRDRDYQREGAVNKGPVDYYKEMPLAFRHSRINLNITLRSISSGIPLRAFDVMGAGGFLMTNYQDDFLEFFVPDEDFVYFESEDDLMDKIDHYLSHDNERLAIAKSGHDKVLAEHTWDERVATIIGDVFG